MDPVEPDNAVAATGSGRRVGAGFRDGIRRLYEFARGRPKLVACDVVGRWSRVTSGRAIIRNEGRIEIGSRTRLTCEFGPVELRTAPGSILTIGSQTAINYSTVIDAALEIRIGDGVSIGPYCIIADSEVGSSAAPTDRAPEAIRIDDGAWIASRVTLLPGTHIGAGAVVTAGSIVAGHIPPGVLAGGIPARVLRHLQADQPIDVADDGVTSIASPERADAGGRGLLISDFTIDPLVPLLDAGTPRLSADVAPYGAVVPTLMSPPSGSFDFAVVWTLAIEVLPSFKAAVAFEPVDEQDLLADVDRFADLIGRGLGDVGCVVVPTWTSPPWQRGRGLIDTRPGGVAWALGLANQRLVASLAVTPNVFVVDAQRWLASSGATGYSERSWYLGKIPFTDEVFAAAAVDIAAAVAAVAGSARKLVVVDLDNTLWGGVVGDVGWEEIRLGGHDSAGEAFVDFQRSLKALQRRGVLLAAASKNEEAVALEAIDRHEAMVLRRDDFVGWRINWSDKAANIAALAADLNLGLQSVVFIDDNPHERERVRAALPEVLVPDWPDDPGRYVRALAELTCFDSPAVTAEDLDRTTMYAAESERSALREHVGSLDDWIRDLAIEVTVAPLAAANLPRATQLLNKTNQMNLRTRRMTSGEFLDWSEADGHLTWCVSVADRLGDAGLTGIVSVEANDGEARIADFVLSCRVMGRRVEQAMVHLAGLMGAQLGATRLSAEYLATAKNLPCRRFFDASDFEQPIDGEYRLDLAAPPAAPADVDLRLPGRR